MAVVVVEAMAVVEMEAMVVVEMEAMVVEMAAMAVERRRVSCMLLRGSGWPGWSVGTGRDGAGRGECGDCSDARRGVAQDGHSLGERRRPPADRVIPAWPRGWMAATLTTRTAATMATRMAAIDGMGATMIDGVDAINGMDGCDAPPLL